MRHGRRWIALLVAAMAMVFAGQTQVARAAGPPNDDFENAITLAAASGSLSASNAGATKQAGEPNHGGNAGGASLWYRWTAPVDGFATFETCGSDFDTLLGIYTGPDVDHLTLIASNDDSCLLDSRVNFGALGGTTYYVAVDGFAGASGNITLTWSEEAPPANDNFANAQNLPGGSGTVYGSNAGASKQPGEPSHGGNVGGHSVWYRWTAPADGSASFDTCGSDFDTLLGVYTGLDVALLTPIASNDDACGLQSRVSFDALGGTTYNVAVDGFGDHTGHITLHWHRAATIIDLGHLPGGSSSFGTAISSDGQVAGDARTASTASHAFRWTEHVGMVDLGTLATIRPSPLPEYDGSGAFGINRSGGVVGAADTDVPLNDGDPPLNTRAFIAFAGMSDLGTLGLGANPGDPCYFDWNDPFVSEPFDPHPWPTGNVCSSTAFAINDNGEIAGQADYNFGPILTHAFRTSGAGGMEDLGTIGRGVLIGEPCYHDFEAEGRGTFKLIFDSLKNEVPYFQALTGADFV